VGRLYGDVATGRGRLRGGVRSRTRCCESAWFATSGHWLEIVLAGSSCRRRRPLARCADEYQGKAGAAPALGFSVGDRWVLIQQQGSPGSLRRRRLLPFSFLFSLFCLLTSSLSLTPVCTHVFYFSAKRENNFFFFFTFSS